MNRLLFSAPPEDVLIVATGGTATARAEYVDGERTGQTLKRNGADLRRVAGAAVSLRGVGLDGANLETCTPLEDIPAGTVFRAEGDVEVGVRAEAIAGFNGGAPRASLAVSVFVERLVPVGNVAELVRNAPRPAAKGGATHE